MISYDLSTILWQPERQTKTELSPLVQIQTGLETFEYLRTSPVRRPACSYYQDYERLNSQMLTSSLKLDLSTTLRNSLTCSIEGGVKSTMAIWTWVNGKPCKDGRVSVKEISRFTPLLKRNSISARVDGNPRAANLPSTNHEKFLGGIAEQKRQMNTLTQIGQNVYQARNEVHGIRDQRPKN